MRMRQRRIDRLLLRAQIAHEAGRDDEAREALAEAELLNGHSSSLADLTPPPPEPLLVELAAAPVIDVPVVEVEDPPALADAVLHEDLQPFEEPQLVEEAQRVDEASLPLAETLLIKEVAPPPRHHRRWVPRVAAILTVGAALAWFTGPRTPYRSSVNLVAHSPAPAVAEDPAPAAAAAPVDPPAVQLAVTEVAATDAPAVPAVPAQGAGDPEPVSLVRREAPAADPVGTAAARLLPGVEPAFAALPAVAPVAPPAPSAAPLAVPIAAATLLEDTPRAPIPVPPPVEAAPSSAAAARSLALEEAGVRSALARYESAYSHLDADAAGAIWPGLDRKALARAFDGLASQHIRLASCDVRIIGDAAAADCTGSATWTPKVGGGARSQQRRWQFRLRNGAEGWQIVGATVR